MQRWAVSITVEQGLFFPLTNRAAITESGGLFEGVSELEHGEILFVPAHDLEPDGEAFGSETGGY